MSCSTFTLRHHLISKHVKPWVAACIKASIKITATGKDVRKALEDFGGNDDISMDGPVPVYHAYTPKAFIDTIVKWIIADDQVCLLYCVVFFTYVFCA